MRVLSEQALSRHVVAGDRRALAEMFRRHQQALFGYCVSVVGNPEDGGDALQNTMAKAIQSLPGETRNLKLKPWLFRVAHNECIDLLRKRRQIDDIADHDPAAKRGLEQTVVDRERLRRVLADLDHLPDRQKSALVMRELNGLSFDEIAAATGSSPSASKQAVYEARCALQDQAKGHDMDCREVRVILSNDDGRVNGRRQVRAHLRSCESCSDFKAGISTRRRELRSLIPPIPAALALALSEALGGSGAGGGIGGLLGLGGGKAALGGGAMKAAAVVAVTAGVGAGTVGVIEHERGNVKNANRAVVSEELDSPDRTIGNGDLPLRFAPVRPARSAGSGPAPRDRPGQRRRNGPDARPDVPLDPVVPLVPGPQDTSPGGSEPGVNGGESNGATPSHGGKPVDLPDASDFGQAQAGSRSSGKGGTGSAATPAKPAQAATPANPEKGSSGGNGNGQAKK